MALETETAGLAKHLFVDDQLVQNVVHRLEGRVIAIRNRENRQGAHASVPEEVGHVHEGKAVEG